MSKLTELIQQVGGGDSLARDELFAEAYPELRKLARSRLRDGGRDTFLETTALVHETYLRFLSSGQLHLDNRRAFFAYASKVMRSVIIDEVRERQALRRGGDWVELTLDTQVADGCLPGKPRSCMSTKRCSRSRRPSRAWPRWSRCATSAAIRIPRSPPPST